MPGTIKAANTHFNDAGTARIGLDGSDIKIVDANGNESAIFQPTSLAVNHVKFGNAAASTYPSINADGDDTNIGLYIKAKGTGEIQAAGGDGVVVTGVTNGKLNVKKGMSLTGIITPTQLTASVNDYAPTGYDTCSVMRISSDTTWSITGLAGGYDGRIVILENVGSQFIVLEHEDVLSAAENRFVTPSNDQMTLRTSWAVILKYDGTSSRWRLISRTISYATQTVMEAGASTSGFTVASNQHYHPSSCKVWVVGTPNSTTIITSYNVTSLGDTATGQQTVTIANDFSSANYCVLVGVDDTLSATVNGTSVSNRAAGSYIMNSVIEGGGLDDPLTAWHSVAYGDL